jgi:hypothetical protein
MGIGVEVVLPPLDDSTTVAPYYAAFLAFSGFGIANGRFAAGGKSISGNTFSLLNAFSASAWHARFEQFFHDQGVANPGSQL